MRPLRRSIKFSVWEGACSCASIGLVENYLIPFGLALKANVAQVGLLSSVPNLISALIQSQTSFIARMLNGPKKSVLSLSLFQSIVLLLFPVLIFLPEDRRVQGLIVLAVLYTTTGGLLLSLWGSIISKFLPLHKRAGFFGWRNMVMGYLIISGCIIGGMLLYAFRSRPLVGFVFLFLSAAGLKLCSYFFGRNIMEPPLHFHHQTVAPLEMARRVFDSRLKSYLLFVGLMNFSCSLVGPLFAVHMLKNLKLNYFVFMVLISASQFMTFFMMGRWGRHANVAGNLQIIRLTTTIFPLLPVLWIFSSNTVYLFFAQIFGGAIWAGYNLCTQNYIYDAIPGSERIQASAMFNMVNGVGIFLGATLGSQLVDLMPILFGYPFFSLILVSSCLRFCVAKIFLPRVKEIRKVHVVTQNELFLSMLGFRPLTTFSDSGKRPIPKSWPGV